ncbi:efflux RND transporter permease subunit [Thalassomonas haliotis]|uniref:MMPL family transporter n=1 Tax=Thalassomonas haliotis TaxID=485448 RepID=A0ABY7VH28_9GAMM|nr:MMPL family transporter [Thalassomonas haliotis]WDE12519.1 MMPL family transporter [Thalassomonas haliotis]
MTNTSTPKWAYLSCIFFTLLTAILAWQARHFEIDASANTLLMENNKHYLLTQLADQRYGAREFILIAYKPSNADLFSRQNLQLVSELGQKITQLARVKQVNSIVNVPIFTAGDSLSADVGQLTWEQQKFSRQTLALSLKQHPLYEGLLINQAQTALSLQVVFAADEALAQVNRDILDIRQHLLSRDLSAGEQARLAGLKHRQAKINKRLEQTRIDEIDNIRSLLKSYRSQGEFYLGGNNLLSYELIQIIQNDLLLFGAAILVVVTLVLWFLFRRLSWVSLPILCCAVSVIITLGLLAAFNFKVTVISANVFALQIILSLAMIIHLIVQYQELVLSHRDWPQQKLVRHTIKKKIKPCFFAGLTTTIGFGSLIFSGVQPVISFGWMMVVAMLVSLLVSLLFFPSLLLVFFNKQTYVAEHKIIEKGMKGFAATVKYKGSALVILWLVFTVIGALGALRLSAESSFLNYFDESTDVRKELTFIDRQFGGSTPFDLLYDLQETQVKQDLIISAEAVQTVTAIQNMLVKQQAIGAITSIADFTRIAQVVNGKPLTEYELTALYKGLDQEMQQQLFGGYFYPQGKQVRIAMRVQDSTPDFNRAQLLADIHREMQAMGVNKEHYRLTSLFVLYEDILSRLLDSQVLTLAIVYAAMAATLMVIFSSLKVALIALVPNFITTAMIMGIMGLFAIPLDLMTITIAAVAMGISMDDTIHYVHRYLDEKQNRPGDSAGWVTQTNLSVGYALIYTTTVIVLGFGTLVFSDFVPSMLFGLLTGVAMVLALLTDITILPVLLNKYLTPAGVKASSQPSAH